MMPTMKELMRKDLQEFSAYAAGGMQVKPVPGKEIVKLNANEMQMGPSPRAMKAMADELQRGHLYPMEMVGKLKKKLADYTGKETDHITVFGGSGAGIQCIAETFIDRDDEVLICSPTYMAYYRLASRFGGKLVEVEADDGVSTDLDKLSAAITDRTKLVVICNPNNPTGTILCPHKLDEFISRLPEHVICIVDEAYIDWVSIPDYPSALKYVEEGKNVIVLRTFSKIYGMAGCRVGYAVANKELTECLGSIANTFSSNRIGLAGAAAALEDKAFKEAAYQNNTQQREYLTKEMEAMGITVVPSQTSFLYFAPHCDTKKCMEILESEGVYIRYFNEEYIRVSIGMPHQNQLFLAALKKALQQLKKECA
ncbi:MAG: histidinol-phosphate transaminase [Lachnospiraceae bacterium]|nr:histidinol-phosphate transaminase [Lachnospiraceae bacterium]